MSIKGNNKHSQLIINNNNNDNDNNNSSNNKRTPSNSGILLTLLCIRTITNEDTVSKPTNPETLFNLIIVLLLL